MNTGDIYLFQKKILHNLSFTKISTSFSITESQQKSLTIAG